LETHAGKEKRKGDHSHSHKKSHKSHKGQKDYSNIRYFIFHKLGQIARLCPKSKDKVRKGKYKRHHAHAAKDDEIDEKRDKGYELIEEYVFISSLTRKIPHGSDTWFIKNGASKHMIRYKNSFSNLIQKDSPHKVKLGDDYQYPIKGVGEAAYILDSGKPMKMKDVLYVLGLNKNLISISSLYEKVFRVSFVNGEVLMWPKGKTIDDAVVIGVQEGGLYKLKGQSDLALVHNTMNLCELWHSIFSHLHYKGLLILIKMVTGLLEIQVNHEFICKVCAQGKNVKKPF
jgi:hypothetical protein